MTKISLRYSRALLTAIGDDAVKLEEIAENLDTAAGVLDEPTILNFFANPKIAAAGKEKVVAKVFGKSGDLLTNFLRLVVQFGKMGEIRNIAKSFRETLSESAGVVTATIESARALDEKSIEKLTAALRKMTRKSVVVESREKPEIIGGVRVRFGDEIVDLSLAGRLGKLQKVLN